MFGRRLPRHLVPVHPDNVVNKDWVILLEAGTIVGPSPQRLRVAKATQERKIAKVQAFRDVQLLSCAQRVQPKNPRSLLLPATLQI